MSVYDVVQVFNWLATASYLAGNLALLVSLFVVAVRRQNRRWRNEDQDDRETR